MSREVKRRGLQAFVILACLSCFFSLLATASTTDRLGRPLHGPGRDGRDLRARLNSHFRSLRLAPPGAHAAPQAFTERNGPVGCKLSVPYPPPRAPRQDGTAAAVNTDADGAEASGVTAGATAAGRRHAPLSRLSLRRPRGADRRPMLLARAAGIGRSGRSPVGRSFRPGTASSRRAAGGKAKSPSPRPQPAGGRGAGTARRPSGGKSARGKAPGGKAYDENKLVHLDFKDADIKTIIKFLSEQTGTNYLYDESVRGKVTVVGPKKVSLKEAVWLLESMLEFKGYTITKAGDFKKVIPLAKAQGDTIETRLEYKESDAPELAEDKEVTQLLRLKHTNAAEIKSAISGLMARPNSLIVHAPTNTLILTENALNIKRLVRIIRELDTPVQGKKVHIVPLQHSFAKETQAQLAGLLKSRVEEKLEPQTRQVTIGAPVVLADERTNSLLVICLEKDFPGIRELIRRLDKDVRMAPDMRVIPVRYADAAEIVTTLEKMMQVGGAAAAKSIAAVADKRTNSIVLSSISEHLIDRAVRIIRELDREVVPEENVVVKVYHLEFAEAEKMAELLKGFEFVPVEEKKSARPGKDKAPESETKVNIIADKATNSLIITTPKHRWPYILDVIKTLDVVRPQVMVEVLIVEIDVTRARELGLDFNFLDEDGDDNRPFAIGNTDGVEGFLSGGGVANGLNVGIVTGGNFDIGAAAGGDMGELSKISLLIRALENDTRANILSTPTLLTSDNETAKISVGEQIQLPASFNTAANTGLNTITNFTTEDLGIILELTPRITKNDHVLLKVNQVIKARTDDTLFSQNIPIISKREVDTNITVKDKTTIVIGGLISETKNKVETGIPLLNKLPFLGKLFRDKRTNVRKTNLMIFLTPHIIRNADDAARLTEVKRRHVIANMSDASTPETSIREQLEALSCDTDNDAGSRPSGDRHNSLSSTADTAGKGGAARHGARSRPGTQVDSTAMRYDECRQRNTSGTPVPARSAETSPGPDGRSAAAAALERRSAATGDLTERVRRIFRRYHERKKQS